jgi:GntR family transcriptional regulator
MFLPIDTSSGLPIFRQIMDQVRRMVASKTLHAGERVESVRDLAAQLQVNPLTVGKAYQELEREGLLEMRRGVGMFVAARPVSLSAQRESQRAAVAKSAARFAAEAAQAGMNPREAIQVVADAIRQLQGEGR